MHNFLISLLICSISMSVIIIFYKVITPILSKRYSVKGLYYAWMVMVIGLVIPIRPKFDYAIVKVNLLSEKMITLVQIGNCKPIALRSPIGTMIYTPTIQNFPWWKIAVIVWAVGMAVFLAYHALNHHYFIKMVRRWSTDLAGQPLAILKNVQTEMRISKPINLYFCPCIGSPTMIGFTNPRILLPRTDWDMEELRFILKHELVHMNRKDLFFKVLVLVTTAIHWFNPIVYLMAKEINVQCEISCDAETIKSADTNMRQHYIETIIGAVKYKSTLKTALSTNFNGGKEGMKKRILTIMDTCQKKTGLVVICVALILTMGTGFAFTASAATGNNSEITSAAALDLNNTVNDKEPGAVYDLVRDLRINSDSYNTTPNFDFSKYEKYGFIYDTETNMLYYKPKDGTDVPVNVFGDLVTDSFGSENMFKSDVCHIRNLYTNKNADGEHDFFIVYNSKDDSDFAICSIN